MTDNAAVTRAEELLYGDYALIVRRLGQAAERAEQAREHARILLESCRNSDRGTPERHLDEEGRSPRTVWLEELFAKTAEIERAVTVNYRNLVATIGDRWREERAAIDSLEPVGIGDVDEPTVAARVG